MFDGIICYANELRRPLGNRSHGYFGGDGETDLGIIRIPLSLVDRISNDAVLDSTDAGREDAIIGINEKLILLGVEVLLDAINVLGGPFIGLSVVDEVVVFEAR